MDRGEYIVVLYDYYGELLSDKQREYFELYYFDNLSLSEISLNDGKSRNAIHKNIKSAESKLLEYEDKLGMYKRDRDLREIIKKINDQRVKKELEKLL